MNQPLVCVLDDDEQVRGSLCDLLRSIGYRAAAFHSAEAFLASPQLHEARGIVADVQMEGITGIELKRHLLMEKVETPLIVITALVEEHWQQDAADAGVENFLRKPFDSASLIRALSSIASIN